MRLADRYILRNHVGPFLLGLSVLTFILVIDMLYSFLELFLVNKVPAKVVLELVVLSLGHIFALTIPMAVLVSTMMAFSHMVGENEITALRSGGISLYRLIAAPLVAALALTVFMFLFNNFVLPETNHRLKNLLMAVRSKKPALDIKPGRFIESIPGYTLYVRQKDDVSGELADLLIFKEERGKDPTITSAEHAQSSATTSRTCSSSASPRASSSPPTCSGRRGCRSPSSTAWTSCCATSTATSSAATSSTAAIARCPWP